MIFSHIIPWRLMTVPAAIGVFIVCVVPAPLLIIIEWMKRCHRELMRRRSARFVCAHADQTFILLAQRPDSTERLCDDVIPALGSTAVLLHNLRVADKQYAALQGAVPRLLGAQLPLLLRCTNKTMEVIELHDVVYTEALCVREASDIVDTIKKRLAS